MDDLRNAGRRHFLKTSAGLATAIAGGGLALASLATAEEPPAIKNGLPKPKAIMSTKSTDVRIKSAELYFLPIVARLPLKFGSQVLSELTCARVRIVVADRAGRVAEGWGETPLSVQWGWPSSLPYEPRHQSMRRFCERLAAAWTQVTEFGHPLELGEDFVTHVIPGLLAEHDQAQKLAEPLPRLASLICASPFDLAIHDAYGNLLGRPTYATYSSEFINRDLADFLEPAEGSHVTFAGRFPDEFLTLPGRKQLMAWHLVGGLDPLEPAEIKPPVPNDKYPVALCDWIKQDGLRCLKIKLRGTDAPWDYERFVRVGTMSVEMGVSWLSADFNGTVTDPAYVNTILDRLLAEHPNIYQRLLYVEQPFAYDLEANPIDARSCSARKPVFMDESAHDWKIIRLGRELGWTGVALKTCKTQSGALLSLCWAKAHGLPLMVQDLSNPMLAQISHVQLAAHAGTIMGVETNGMQFFPDASTPEAQIHPGLYRRRDGQLDLTTLGPTGFGFRVRDIARVLPAPVVSYGG